MHNFTDFIQHTHNTWASTSKCTGLVHLPVIDLCARQPTRARSSRALTAAATVRMPVQRTAATQAGRGPCAQLRVCAACFGAYVSPSCAVSMGCTISYAAAQRIEAPYMQAPRLLVEPRSGCSALAPAADPPAQPFPGHNVLLQITPALPVDAQARTPGATWTCLACGTQLSPRPGVLSSLPLGLPCI